MCIKAIANFDYEAAKDNLVETVKYLDAGKSLGEKLSRNKHRLDADGNPLPEDTTTSSDSANIGKG